MILIYLINYPPYFIVLFIFLSVLLVVLHKSHKRLKEKESKKIHALYTELKLEKNISKKLRVVPREIEKIELETTKKLMNIKVDILNIDFTIYEIFK